METQQSPREAALRAGSRCETASAFCAFLSLPCPSPRPTEPTARSSPEQRREQRGSCHEKVNHKHKSTREPCSSDNYPQKAFSGNYRAGNGSAVQTPSFLRRRLRRWPNDSCLGAARLGVEEARSNALPVRDASQKVVMPARPAGPSHRPNTRSSWESELSGPFRRKEPGRGGSGHPAW